MTASATAELLVGALPSIARLRGEVVVVKLGGHAMDDPATLASLAQDVVLLRHLGARPVVVHGGGPQIDAHLDRLGIVPEFVGGLRVTGPDTMEVVRMVLRGQVNGDVVGAVNRLGPYAVGLSGQDGGLLTARRRTEGVDGAALDVGMVGDVCGVEPSLLRTLVDDGRIPVVATVAPSADGELLNVNADSAAAAIAVATAAARLLLLTDVPGLLDRQADPASVVSTIAVGDLESRLGTLTAGMAPKMEACARAVRGGVPTAHVLDGRVPHVVLAATLTGDPGGTTVTP